MKKMKKINKNTLFGLGTLAVVIAPVATLVACGGNGIKNNTIALKTARDYLTSSKNILFNEVLNALSRKLINVYDMEVRAASNGEKIYHDIDGGEDVKQNVIADSEYNSNYIVSSMEAQIDKEYRDYKPSTQVPRAKSIIDNNDISEDYKWLVQEIPDTDIAKFKNVVDIFGWRLVQFERYFSSALIGKSYHDQKLIFLKYVKPDDIFNKIKSSKKLNDILKTFNYTPVQIESFWDKYKKLHAQTWFFDWHYLNSNKIHNFIDPKNNTTFLDGKIENNNEELTLDKFKSIKNAFNDFAGELNSSQYSSMRNDLARMDDRIRIEIENTLIDPNDKNGATIYDVVKSIITSKNFNNLSFIKSNLANKPAMSDNIFDYDQFGNSTVKNLFELYNTDRKMNPVDGKQAYTSLRFIKWIFDSIGDNENNLKEFINLKY